jgi:hypothetical protein
MTILMDVLVSSKSRFHLLLHMVVVPNDLYVIKACLFLDLYFVYIVEAFFTSN